VGLLQIVQYLNSKGTDSDSTIRAKADQQVQELDKKYPGFIQVTTINTRQTCRFTKIGIDRW
jgi:cohesin loading factor subunit SCC2